MTIGAQDERSVRFKGFTVTGGSSYEEGGGLLVTGRAEIEDNIITGNSGYHGGGIAVWGPGATIRHNHFVGNTAGSSGGGIYDASGEDVLISDNLFEGNDGFGSGGGIALAAGSPRVLRNVIRQNHANDGAGISSGASSPYVADNLVYANGGSEAYYGGGVHIFSRDIGNKSKGMWINNTIADNSAAYGSQIALSSLDARALIANNAISASDGSVALYCADRRGALPRFETNDVYSTGGAATGGSCAAAAVARSNFSLAPGFADSAKGRPYHLAPDSPLVDVGTNKVVRGSGGDLSGGRRIVDGGHGPFVDIGAYEYRP